MHLWRGVSGRGVNAKCGERSVVACLPFGSFLLVYKSPTSVCRAFRVRKLLADQFYSHLAVVDGNDNGSDDHNQTTAIALSACFFSLAFEHGATKMR